MSQHHYLPEMYLSRWTRDPDLPHHDPFLYVHYRGAAKPKRRGVGNVASEAERYRVDPAKWEGGVEPGHVETFLSKVESVAARAFKRIERLGYVPEDLRADVAQFVAFMDARTPWSFERAKGVMERALAQTPADLARELAAEMPRIRAHLRERGHAVKGRSDEDVIRIVLSILSPDCDSDYLIHLMLREVTVVQPLLARMRWGVVHAPPGTAYVTTDVPVTLPEDGPPRSARAGRGLGFGTPGVEVWFPLNPKMLLVASANEVDHVRAATVREIDAVNGYMIERCHDFVITHRERPKVAALVASLPKSLDLVTDRTE